MSFKQMYRQQPKHFYGYRRVNYYKAMDSTSNMHRVTPVAIGRLCGFWEKIESIFGDSFIQSREKKPMQSHPYLKLMVKKVVIYEYLHMVKRQKRLEYIVDDLGKGFKTNRYEQLKKLIKQAIESYKDLQKYTTNTIPRIQKLKLFEKQMQKVEESTFEEMRSFLANNIGNIHVPKEALNFVTSQKFIREQLAALRLIEPLRFNQQHAKLKLFEKYNKEAFQAEMLADIMKGVRYYNFKVTKLSTQSEPVLQRCSQFIQLRADSPEQYKIQSALFIKDIFRQLQKYEQQSSNNNDRHYFIGLSPDAVVVDQLSLYPKLHYEPALLEAFGLRNKPVSVQALLAFDPTPHNFNYFQALEELEPDNQLMLNDPFYGCLELYESDRKQLSDTYLKIIEDEKKQLQQVHEKILAWRFLLLSHYILHGRQFGRKRKPSSSTEAKQYFKSALTQMQSLASESASQLQLMLGLSSKQMENGKFTGKMSQLQEFIRIDNDDSVIKGHKYDCIVRYSNLRFILADRILRYMNSNLLFQNLLNMKRKIIMFLVTAIQVLNDTVTTIDLERKKPGQRKVLQKYLSDKQVKKIIFKNVYQIFSRIEKYNISNPNQKDLQAHYLLENDGPKIYHLIKTINENIKKIDQISQILNRIENTPNRSQNKNQYKQNLKEMQTIAIENLTTSNKLLTQLIITEIWYKQQSLHKLPDRNRNRDQERLQITWKASQLVTRRFSLVVLTLLSISSQNLMIYQIFAVPALVNLQFEKQEDLSIKISNEQLEQQKTDLDDLAEAIDAQSLLQKKLQYLTVSIPASGHTIPKKIVKTSPQIIEDFSFQQ